MVQSTRCALSARVSWKMHSRSSCQAGGAQEKVRWQMVPQAPPAGIATLSLLLQTTQPASATPSWGMEVCFEIGACQSFLSIPSPTLLACCVKLYLTSFKHFNPHFTVSCSCNGIPLATIGNHSKKMLNVKCLNNFFQSLQS